jgi:hypothetical protein
MKELFKSQVDSFYYIFNNLHTACGLKIGCGKLLPCEDDNLAKYFS